MSAVLAAVSGVSTVFALLAHAVAWLLYLFIVRAEERVRSVEEKLDAATRFLERRKLADSTLRMFGQNSEKFDPDLNEMEIEVARASVPDVLLEVGSAWMKTTPADSKPLDGPVVKPTPPHAAAQQEEPKQQDQQQQPAQVSPTPAPAEPAPAAPPPAEDKPKSKKSDKKPKSKSQPKSKKSDKKLEKKDGEPPAAAPPEDKKEEEKKEEDKKDEPTGPPAPGQEVHKAPADQNAMAAMKDDNYKTLNGLDNADVFEPKGGEPAQPKFQAPKKVEKVDGKDPQYQTLAGIENNIFNDGDGGGGKTKEGVSDKRDAKGSAKGKDFKPPEKVEKKDGKDPQYQTLADVNDNIFKT